MPAYGRSKRRSGRRVVSASRPYISGRSRAATKGRTFSGSKRRQRPSLATKAARTKRLRSAVVANAKAVDALKRREFGYWQTTNSVLGGAWDQEHKGNSYNLLTTEAPVLIHLNNLHSVNGEIPNWTPVDGIDDEHNEQHGACHLLVADPNGAVEGQDGLVREFLQPETFAVNGVMQKPKRTGPYMYPRVGYTGRERHEDVPLIPIPNGKKIRWGGVNLQFKVEGALQDTQFDFFIVKCNKETPMSWDPWHQTIPDAARSVPATLPYTINDFKFLHHEMYPNKLNTNRYSVLAHSRMLVNNVHRVTGQTAVNHLFPDNAKYATGNTWSHTADGSGPHAFTPTHPASTPPSQTITMSYKPNSVVRPMRNFIGERIDNTVEKRGSRAHANPNEPATLGTMSWDNFKPEDNVWLVMTTNHQYIATPPIEGPYSHAGYHLMEDAPSTATHGNNKEPHRYSEWVAAGFGTAREDQLKHMCTVYGSNGQQHAGYIDGGPQHVEWQKLIAERLTRDEYRNPRIHIFRRTWWQDEHIPTEDTEAVALMETEARLQPTPSQTANMQTVATPVEKAAIQTAYRGMQISLSNKRKQPDLSHINMAGDDPVGWALHPSGHPNHDPTGTIPNDLAQLIIEFAEQAGLCDLLGVDRRTYRLMRGLKTMAFTPTPLQPSNETRPTYDEQFEEY